MRVSTIKGASSYVRITTSSTDLSVLLSDDMPIPQSLTESASEMRKNAARLLARAETIEKAAIYLGAKS